jgi:hypothetical protein
MQHVVEDGDTSHFQVLARAFPIFRRKKFEHRDVLTSQTDKFFQGFAQILAGIVTFNRKLSLVIRENIGIILFKHQGVALQGEAFCITQVANNFNYRPTFIAAFCGESPLLADTFKQYAIVAGIALKASSISLFASYIVSS